MTDNIEMKGHMQKLDVKDGDVVVVQSCRMLSEHEGYMIRETIETTIKAMGVDAKVLLLGDDIVLGVLRRSP